ncbi:MAG: hypothetical protein VX458_01790 [Bacteroidota bacterium]|nr:hypothetical protein [Bacteroidota bacterium]
MRICNPSKLLSQPRIIMFSPFIGSFIWFINELNSISDTTIEYLMAFNYENQYNL